jgi:PhoH-like ATPase
MGYLPGDIGDKFNPFMACLFDNLANIERLGGPLKTDMMSKIEITPVAFLRGRSLENCIIIVDEAQNLDLITLKAILTRVGQYCKVVLLGSLNQIDSKVQAKKEKCDFQRVQECLQEFDFVGEIELIQSKRSKICALVDEKLRELK